MIECLISLLIAVLIAIIVIYILEVALSPFLPLPAPAYTIIRLIVGLIILLYFLSCLGFIGGFGGNSLLGPMHRG